MKNSNENFIGETLLLTFLQHQNAVFYNQNLKIFYASARGSPPCNFCHFLKICHFCFHPDLPQKTWEEPWSTYMPKSKIKTIPCRPCSMCSVWTQLPLGIEVSWDELAQCLSLSMGLTMASSVLKVVSFMKIWNHSLIFKLLIDFYQRLVKLN